MSVTTIASITQVFHSRLATLQHILHTGKEHLSGSDAAYLQCRLAPGMHPLGTQIAFTCNQPRNFAFWLKGLPSADLDPNVDSITRAEIYIHETRDLLSSLSASDAALPPSKHLVLGPELHADLTGEEYCSEFLLPNFYFHLVASYAILRASGVPLGKRDYMLHFLPKVTQNAIEPGCGVGA